MNLGIDIQVIVTGIVGLITTITTGFVSWLFAKKKYNAEVDSNLIENMQKSLDFYMKLSDDNKARLDEALRRNDFLQDEITKLKDQVNELTLSLCYDLSCELRKKATKRVFKTAKSLKDKPTENHNEIESTKKVEEA